MSRLLSLPRELRNSIYDSALSDLRNSPAKPYTIFKSDFSIYCALRLVNHQVAAEIKDIFTCQYAPTLTININSIPRLYDVLAASKSHIPALSETQFRLSMSAVSGDYAKHEAGWKEKMTCFINLQQFGSYDRTKFFKSWGWQHIRAVLFSSGVDPPVDGREKHISAVFGQGLWYAHYSRNHATKTGGAVVVVEGGLGGLVMEERENVEYLRARKAEGPMTRGQWLRVQEILRWLDESRRQ